MINLEELTRVADDSSAVEKLLSGVSAADLNWATRCAAETRNEKVLAILMLHGGDKHSALQGHIIANNVEKVRELIGEDRNLVHQTYHRMRDDSSGVRNYTVLSLAAEQCQHPEIFHVLLEAGADLYAEYQRVDHARVRVGTAISRAIDSGNLIALRIFIEADAACLNKKCFSEMLPLEMALIHESDDIFDILLKAKAPGDIHTVGGNHIRESLKYLPSENAEKMLCRLAKRGVDMNQHYSNDGSFLMRAVAHSWSAECIAAMLKAGARVNYEAESGGTALHAASKKCPQSSAYPLDPVSNRIKVLELLVKAGGDLFKKNVLSYNPSLLPRSAGVSIDNNLKSAIDFAIEQVENEQDYWLNYVKAVFANVSKRSFFRLKHLESSIEKVYKKFPTADIVPLHLIKSIEFANLIESGNFEKAKAILELHEGLIFEFEDRNNPYARLVVQLTNDDTKAIAIDMLKLLMNKHRVYPYKEFKLHEGRVVYSGCAYEIAEKMGIMLPELFSSESYYHLQCLLHEDAVSLLKKVLIHDYRLPRDIAALHESSQMMLTPEQQVLLLKDEIQHLLAKMSVHDRLPPPVQVGLLNSLLPVKPSEPLLFKLRPLSLNPTEHENLVTIIINLQALNELLFIEMSEHKRPLTERSAIVIGADFYELMQADNAKKKADNLNQEEDSDRVDQKHKRANTGVTRLFPASPPPPQGMSEEGLPMNGNNKP